MKRGISPDQGGDMRVLFHDAIGRDTVRLPDNDAAVGIDGGRIDTGLLQRQAVVDPQVPRLVDGNNRNVGGNCIELLASWMAFSASCESS